MLVYRMEDADGRGPFRNSGVMWKMSEAMGRNRDDFDCFHNDFPTPDEEGLNFTRDHKCGCVSLRQLVTWFPRPCRDVLAREGYDLVVLSVPDALCEVGEEQVIYVFA